MLSEYEVRTTRGKGSGRNRGKDTAACKDPSSNLCIFIVPHKLIHAIGEHWLARL